MFKHANRLRRDEHHVTRKVMSMNVEGYKGRGRPKKVWMVCVKNDMCVKGVTAEMTNDRDEWRNMLRPDLV